MTFLHAGCPAHTVRRRGSWHCEIRFHVASVTPAVATIEVRYSHPGMIPKRPRVHGCQQDRVWISPPRCQMRKPHSRSTSARRARPRPTSRRIVAARPRRACTQGKESGRLPSERVCCSEEHRLVPFNVHLERAIVCVFSPSYSVPHQCSHTPDHVNSAVLEAATDRSVDVVHAASDAAPQPAARHSLAIHGGRTIRHHSSAHSTSAETLFIGAPAR